MRPIEVIRNYCLPLCSYGRRGNYIFEAGFGLAETDLAFEQIVQFINNHQNEVILPSHIFERSDLAKLIEFVKTSAAVVRIQVSAPHEAKVQADRLIQLLRNGLNIEILFQDTQDIQDIYHFIKTAGDYGDGSQVRWVYLPTKLYQVEKVIQTLPAEVAQNFFISFLPTRDFRDIYFEPQLVFLTLQKLRSNLDFENVPLRLLVYQNFYDSSNPEKRHLEFYLLNRISAMQPRDLPQGLGRALISGLSFAIQFPLLRFLLRTFLDFFGLITFSKSVWERYSVAAQSAFRYLRDPSLISFFKQIGRAHV